MIIVRTGRDPNNLASALGSILSEEFELVHVDCNDVFLVKGKDGGR